MLHDGKVLKLYFSIQFPMGTNVDVTFNTLGPALPKSDLMQFCMTHRELQNNPFGTTLHDIMLKCYWVLLHGVRRSIIRTNTPAKFCPCKTTHS